MSHFYIFLFFFLLMGIFLINLFTIIEISKLPVEQHKYKHFWIRIILLVPMFGAAFYYYHSKTSKKGSFDVPETYDTVANRMIRRHKKSSF